MIHRRFFDNNHEWYPSETVNKPPIHWPNSSEMTLTSGTIPDYFPPIYKSSNLTIYEFYPN